MAISQQDFLQKRALRLRLEQAKLNSKPKAVDYRDHLYILDKRERIVPFNPNRVQAHYLANRTQRNLILKARQQGISTLIQADHFVTAITDTALIATLAHDDQTTQKLRRMAARFYDNLPAGIKPPRGLDNATTTTYPLTQSEVTIVTAGSKNAGRGGTYGRVHGSEVAFWKDAESVMAGIMQGVPDRGVIDLESTPNGAQGWFYTRCMEALEGRSDWSLYFYPWWWADEYRLPLADGEALDYSDIERQLIKAHGLTAEQVKWRRKKIGELGHLFLQEYPEDPRSCFLRSGLGYMGDIEHAFTAPVDATPQAGHEYYAGLDFGQQNDFTVCSVIDRTTMQQVALLRVNQVAWAEMRRQVRELCRSWRVKELKPETNSMGSTNIEALHDEFRVDGLSTAIVPFTTTNATKTAAMAALRESLHSPSGLRLMPTPEQKHEMSGLQAKQTITGVWQIAAPDGEHDDIPIGNALALDAIIGGGMITIERAPSVLRNWRR